MEAMFGLGFICREYSQFSSDLLLITIDNYHLTNLNNTRFHIDLDVFLLLMFLI